jgi:hypothetical protein
MKRFWGQDKIGNTMPLLEWQTCESKDAWQTALNASTTHKDLPRTVTSSPSRMARHWRDAAIVLAALCLISGWLWHTANVGLGQIEAELQNAVAGDLWRASQTQKGSPPQGRIGRDPHTTSIEVLSFEGEQAVVEYTFRTGLNQQLIRQTRAYRQNALGWQRSKPAAESWGSPRSRESDHFIFRYYTLDEAAVGAAAVELDRLFDERLATWIAPSDETSSVTTDAKYQVVVDPAAIPGVIPRRNGKDNPFVIASPAAYLNVHTITDADLLAQTVYLGLVDELVGEVRDRDKVRSDWKPLLDGLRLWLLWAPSLPLAARREQTVQWVFFDLDPSKHDDPFDTSAFQDELCSLYGPWMAMPLEIQIPVACGNPTWSKYLDTWRDTYVPPIQLGHLTIITPPPDLQSVTDGLSRPSHPGYAVVAATVIEYVAATYGQARLLAMITGLNEHTNWESLTLAVFGVSAVEFETGWRRYLAEQYAVVVEP